VVTGKVELWLTGKLEKQICGKLFSFVLCLSYSKYNVGNKVRNIGADWEKSINPLNAELNPTCHLLALLEAHHILRVSMIRVKEVKVHIGLWCHLRRRMYLTCMDVIRFFFCHLIVSVCVCGVFVV
jgi:hypothetical protein